MDSLYWDVLPDASDSSEGEKVENNECTPGRIPRCWKCRRKDQPCKQCKERQLKKSALEIAVSPEQEKKQDQRPDSRKITSLGLLDKEDKAKATPAKETPSRPAGDASEPSRSSWWSSGTAASSCATIHTASDERARIESDFLDWWGNWGSTSAAARPRRTSRVQQRTVPQPPPQPRGMSPPSWGMERTRERERRREEERRRDEERKRDEEFRERERRDSIKSVRCWATEVASYEERGVRVETRVRGRARREEFYAPVREGYRAPVRREKNRSSAKREEHCAPPRQEEHHAPPKEEHHAPTKKEERPAPASTPTKPSPLSAPVPPTYMRDVLLLRSGFRTWGLGHALVVFVMVYARGTGHAKGLWPPRVIVRDDDESAEAKEFARIREEKGWKGVSEWANSLAPKADVDLEVDH
ncbi:hypothetical protein CSOJ01_05528 [Colletotrichum sojae]|uniref:Uncharacterized protein n=1 Tax=Colletotrichum sojae TaxID=2175907 RepID=A0A8H6JFX4_9PEZI|nr:hypothetical protein CSOJ01_05528 [Colletotrichum sojae]